MVHIELMPVGREILTGRTHESNARWMAQRITAMGGLVRRVTVVDDNKEAIAEELQAAWKRGAHFLITTGGLGPTFDDVTMAGLAKGAGLMLELHHKPLAFVQKKYEEYYAKGHVQHPDLTPERQKMAILPKGSEWYENETGAAPGAYFRYRGMGVFALPGPPRELQPMYLAHVEPILAQTLGRRAFAEETVRTDGTDESVLTKACVELTDDIPGLHAKTNPTFFGDSKGLTITLSVWADSELSCNERMKRAKSELKNLLQLFDLYVLD